jgi:CRP-like cAMP-binding protein
VRNIYKKGQTLFVQGNPSFGIYYIESGKVKTSKVSDDGKELIVRLIRKGDLLGHHHLFVEGCHSVTATCIENAEVMFLDKRFTKDLLKRSSTVSNYFFKKMANETQILEEKYTLKNVKNVRERLAALLIELNEQDGKLGGNGTWSFPL